MANLSGHLLNYRWHANNASTRRKDKMVETANQIRADLLRHSLNYQIEEKETRVLNQVSAQHLNSQEDLKVFEALLLKLLKKNKEVNYYNQKTLQDLFFHQWLAICLRQPSTSRQTNSNSQTYTSEQANSSRPTITSSQTPPSRTQTIRICLKSDLFTLSSLIKSISRRNFRSLTNALFQS